MGNAFDALLGRVLSAGVEQEIRGGLNFKGGLAVTPDADNNRNDVDVNFLRVLGVGEISVSSSSATTISGASTWTEAAGTFALNTSSSSVWTLASSGAGLVWGGSEAALVLCFAAATITPSAADKLLGIRWANNGSVEGNYAASYMPDIMSLPLSGLIAVDPSDEVSVMVANLTDTANLTVSKLSALVVAIGAV
jgi:hypothetical protein